MRSPKSHAKRADHDADVTVTVTDADHPGHPVVLTEDDLEFKTKKGKKRGSSRATRRLEDIESRVSKAIHRVTKSVNHGVTTYQDHRDKSARKRRDGALVDFYENVARGVSVAISEASPATVDVAEALNSRETRRQIRRVLNNLPRLPFLR